MADVGGVAGPVAAGSALPLDGDVDVDAERAGQDGGGQLGGELEQGGGAGLGRADPEAAQALGQPVAADRPAGLAAGEQPGRGALVTEDGVPVPGRHQAGCEAGQRFGQRDGGLPEPEPDLAAVGVDVGDGQAADRRRPLGVEQQQQATLSSGLRERSG